MKAFIGRIKRVAALVMCLTLLIPALPAAAAEAAPYTDVPAGSWAAGVIAQARERGVMGGQDDKTFGYGANIKRGEFAAMLVRLMGWSKVAPDKPSFTDVSADRWYYSDVETALAHGAVKSGGGFDPEGFITRGDMAIMLVRALGCDSLASDAAGFGMPFADVTDNKGYITIASDLGIINGVSATQFAPGANAKREEGAAMMMRLYDKYYAKTGYTNAFYALSSYAQRDLMKNYDCVTFGWSRMEVGADGAAVLNTTSAGGNEYCVPDGYKLAVDAARAAGCATSLNVIMRGGAGVSLADGTTATLGAHVLLSPERRAQAVEAITRELAAVYPGMGASCYDGVTIDFEELRGAEQRTAFTEFMRALAERVRGMGKTVAVAVHARLRGGADYDGYDYRALGSLCDKMILMAHDYAPKSVTPGMSTVTPVSPFPDVYYALRAVCDADTGVAAADRSKVLLAISFGSAGWMSVNGQVVKAMSHTPAELYARLIRSDTQRSWSERYKSPSIAYYDDSDGSDNIVWYEDERSVAEKALLARMFGIGGLSVWRLGIVPAYADPAGDEIDYDLSNVR